MSRSLKASIGEASWRAPRAAEIIAQGAPGARQRRPDELQADIERRELEDRTDNSDAAHSSPCEAVIQKDHVSTPTFATRRANNSPRHRKRRRDTASPAAAASTPTVDPLTDEWSTWVRGEIGATTRMLTEATGDADGG